MAIRSAYINGETVYIDDNGRRYTPEQARQLNNVAVPDYSLTSRIAMTVGNAPDMESPSEIVRSAREEIDSSRTPTAVQNTANYDFFKNTDADKNQRAENAAPQFNIPQQDIVTAAKETQDEAIQKAETPRYDFEEMQQKAPVLSRFLNTPENMAVMHDDIQTLQETESIGEEISTAFELSRKMYRLNEIDHEAKEKGIQFDQLDAETQKERKQLLARINTLQAKMPKSVFSVGTAVQLATSFGEDLVASLQPALIGAASGALAGSTVLPGLGTVGGAITGALWGTTFGQAASAGIQASAEKYRELINKGYNATDAQRGATLTGGVNFLVNMAFMKGIGKTASIVNTANKTGVLKQLGYNTIENSVLGAAVGAGDVLGNKSADDNYTYWNMDDIQTMAGGAASMALLGAVMNVPGLGWAGVNALREQAYKSRLMKRNPELYRKFTNETTPFEVSVNTDRFYNYLSSLEPEQAQIIMRHIGLTDEDLARHMTTGEDIRMDSGTAITLPQGVLEDMYADMKVDGKPSLREIDEAYHDGDAVPEKDNPVRKEADEELLRKSEMEEENARTQEISDEVDNDRTYLASNLLEGTPSEAQKEDSLTFNLQLFGHKKAKTVASEFQGGKLTPEAEAEFERIAEKYGYSSGDEMAKDILSKRTKDEEKSARVGEMILNVRRENGTDAEGLDIRAQLNDDNIRKTADELETMRKASTMEGMEAKEDTATDEMAKNLDIMESVLDLDEMANGRKAQGLREKMAALRKELNEKWKAKVSDVKEEKKALRKELNEKWKAKVSDVNEKWKAKVSDVKEEKKDLVKRYNDILKEVKESTKDSPMRRAARSGTVKVSDVNKIARYSLSKMSIKEARDFRKLFADARKARANSEKAYRKAVKTKFPSMKNVDAVTETGNVPSTTDSMQIAIFFKNRELVLQQMAKDAIRMNDTVRKWEANIRQVQKALPKDRSKAMHGKTAFSGDEYGYNQLGILLERFGVPAKGFSPQMAPESLYDWAIKTGGMPRDKSNRIIGEVDPQTGSLRDWVEIVNGATGAVRIPDWILREGDRFNFYDLTADRAEDFINTLNNIRHVSKNMRNLISEGRKENVNDLMKGMIEELNQSGNNHRKSEETRNSRSGFTRMFHDQQNMDTIIRTISPVHKKLMEFWQERQWNLMSKESADLKVYKDQFQKIWERYTAKEKNRISNKKIYLESMGVNCTKSDLIAIALNLGSEGNREKLLRTKPVDFEDAHDWNLGNIMDELQKNLDERDWETVQMTWNLVGSLWDKIAEHELRVTGFTPKMVAPEGFEVTVNGKKISLTGGYYPLKKDFRGNVMDAQVSETERLTGANHSAMVATTAHGFAKERTNAQYSVSLDLNNSITHVVDVLHDYYFRDYCADANRIFSNKEFQDALYRAGGVNTVIDFRDYIKAIAGSENRNVGYEGMSRIASFCRNSSARASIMFNLGVLTQNFANVLLYPGAVKGFGVSDAVMGMLRYGLCDYWAKSLWRFWDKQSAAKYAEMYLSPMMNDRLQRPDLTMRDFMPDGRLNAKGLLRRGYDHLVDFSGYLMYFSDSLTSVPMWRQAYHKKLMETGDTEAASRFADTLIQRVNGPTRGYNASKFMRADAGTFYGMCNTFMGFFNTEFNRWVVEASRVAGRDMRQDIKNLPRFLAFAASRMGVFALLSNVLMGKTPDEDADNEEWTKWAAASALEYPLMNIGLVKDVAPVAIESMLGMDNFGYRPPIAFNLFGQSVRALDAMGKYVSADRGTREEDQALENMLEQTGKTALVVTGGPTILNNIFWNAYNYDQGVITEWRPTDFMRRRPKKERE